MHRFILALAAPLVLAAGVADAHPKLLRAFPAPGAAVTGSPPAIRIAFNEPVFARLSAIALTTPVGAPVKLGTTVADPRDRRQLSAPIIGRLAPGLYKVTWRAVAADTHRVTGGFAFRVR